MSQDTQRERAAAASSGQRCGATTGPTAEQWEAHRQIITDHYKTMKLVDLDIFMRKEHGFCASKRMYNQRFKQWNISKYLKMSEKKELLDDCGGSIKLLTERFRDGKIPKPQYERTLRWIRSQQNRDAPRPMSVDLRAVSMEIILGSLRGYHHSLKSFECQSKGPLDSRFLDWEPSPECEELWLGIISGMKSLAKLNAKAQAGVTNTKSTGLAPSETTFAMLRQVGSLAAPAMAKRPLDFMYELLIELTSDQSRACPDLRRALLRLFHQEAQRVFEPDHPIAVICRELGNDVDTSELTYRSLEYMSNLALELWGEHHVLTFKVQTAHYKALLKSRNMKRAAQVGTQLLQASQKKFGTYSKEARSACHRLGQLYAITNELALAKGRPDDVAIARALYHYRQVIQQPVPEPNPVPGRMKFIEDETTLSTMADIAFVYNRWGKDAEAVAWYQKAADMSTRICQPSSSTRRVTIGLLINKLREMGKLEQVAAWEAINCQPGEEQAEGSQ